MSRLIKFLSISALALSAMAINANAVELKGSHKANQVACKSCHTKGMKEAGTMEGCLSCHKSYEAVRALTEGKANLEVNPHIDGHMGELDCTECHHAHKPSKAVCNECHGFDFVTP
ncbi:cytochrome c3 family protein [Shewanella avicenniae]|uniref:Cytochrome c3 family protein n=1 Tax=Shewanella avicenniae TaxID=2814294 RepID=A0ABX7QT50_9GAMM|nr:cytochrome c3 family protein [Shewanella avicenniae]QSX33861.1 cytochrome c3 family protein [Shewanella avicenniae]